MEFQDETSVSTTPHKFLLTGIITSEDFQKTRYALLKLYKSFPKKFDSPDIRPMLDVEWTEFITKYQRRLGNGLWSVKNRVAIFRNGEFLGDFDAFNEFIWKKWKYVYNQDWHDLASRHLLEYLEKKNEHYRQLVYFLIAIDKRVIGSLLFELYNDVVPLTCENFMNRCRSESDGYIGAPIHRIVLNSWIQCGGYDLTPIKIPCENYAVPHDKRGVLSMCNNGPHKDNSTQFYISLQSAPWMDHRFVAFGQLIHGENILRTIEAVPTYYQSPLRDIRIVKCGEFKTRLQDNDQQVIYTADEIDQWKEIQQQIDILTYLKSYQEAIPDEHQPDDTNLVSPPAYQESCATILSQSKIKTGTYSLKTDCRIFLPFRHLLDDDDVEAEEDDSTCETGYPIMKYTKEICGYNDNFSPDSSDVTI